MSATRGLLADAVGHADPGQPRGRDGEERVDRHRQHPGGEHGVAQTAVDGGRPAVEVDQRRGHDEQLGREVDVAEQPHHRAGVERALDRVLDSEAEVALEVEDRVRVVGGRAELARGDEAADVVDEVGGQEQEQLRARAHPHPIARAAVGVERAHQRPLPTADSSATSRRNMAAAVQSASTRRRRAANGSCSTW